jgi:aminoglycoside 3-N-acetyltransferase
MAGSVADVVTIRATLHAALPVETKARVKFWLARFRAAWINSFYSFTPDDLLAALRRLGIEPGDVVIAHTSFGRFEGFRGGVAEAIRTLQGAVGAEGTLLMPTLPFDGTAVGYVNSGAVTDIVRTPSRMGFMTEVFRRLPGVTRSIHPTHPIAIWGKHAAAMAAGHEAATSPCGDGSPFRRLLDLNGKILLAGVSIRSMTFFHCVEELIEPQMPFSPFAAAWFEAKTKGPDGAIHVTRMRLFDPAVSARRDCELMIEPLKRRGFWHQTRVGRLDLVVLHASEVTATLRAMAAEGKFCYHDA